jgi:cyclohexyl-isocyanide hydratase
VPSTTPVDCPNDLDLPFVPGGLEGTIAVVRDDEFLAFLRERARRSRYVTSVCTGALILGAAALLKGYRATTHWAFRDLLPLHGSIPVWELNDRNRITGGGVTSGIDFGLAVTARNARCALCRNAPAIERIRSTSTISSGESGSGRLRNHERFAGVACRRL